MSSTNNPPGKDIARIHVSIIVVLVAAAFLIAVIFAYLRATAEPPTRHGVPAAEVIAAEAAETASHALRADCEGAQDGTGLVTIDVGVCAEVSAFEFGEHNQWWENDVTTTWTFSAEVTGVPERVIRDEPALYEVMTRGTVTVNTPSGQPLIRDVDTLWTVEVTVASDGTVTVSRALAG